MVKITTNAATGEQTADILVHLTLNAERIASDKVKGMTEADIIHAIKTELAYTIKPSFHIRDCEVL